MEPMINPVYEFTVTRRKIGDVTFKLGDGPKVWKTQINEFVKIVQPLFEGLDRERIVAAFFNVGGQLIGLQVVGEGGSTSVEIQPVTLVRAAIMADARLVVLTHNHPNGTLDPSEEDRALAPQQAEALGTFNIVLVDSLIVNESGWVSLRQDAEKMRHGAIVSGTYLPDPSDYDLSRPEERIRCAAELRLSAGAQVDPNLAEALRLTASVVEGQADPLNVMMQIERLRARSVMKFDPNGEDGPERLN
jgi:hypothetical protein